METSLSKNNNRGILIYYFLLLLIVVFRTSETEPNAVIRYGFLTAFFAPIVLKYTDLFPACLITFMTIGTYGFAYSFFPYNAGIYVILSLLGLIFLNRRSFGVSVIFFVGLVYIVVINLFNSDEIPNCVYSLATTILMVYYLSNSRQLNSMLLLNAFCVVSISLSMIYVANYQRFLSDFEYDMERSGWTDPNYLSCVIGMGVVSAIYLLVTVKSNIYNKFFWMVTIAFSFIAQVMMASRGGILAVAASSVILIFMTKTKLKYKLLIVLAITAFVIWLYNNNYFELLQYRIEHDNGTGSGRSEIWISRLKEFSTFDLLPTLFGVGYDRSLYMGGYVSAYGFHNDFVAILCQYGVIGLVTFIYLLVKPIIGLQNKGRMPVAAFIIYIICFSLTLEPFTAGRLSFFGFYLMVAVLANFYRKTPSLNL